MNFVNFKNLSNKFQLNNYVSFAFIAASCLGSMDAGSVLAARFVQVDINGVKGEFTAVENALFKFNFTLFQFGDSRPGKNDDVVEFDVSGDQSIFKLVVTGQAVNMDKEFKIAGTYSDKGVEGGTTSDNPFWDYSFNFKLDRISNMFNVSDMVAVSNGIIRHREDSHPKDQTKR
jgi:hypothetical protein